MPRAGRVARRGPRRLRGLRRAGRAAGRGRAVHGRPRPGGLAALAVRRRPPPGAGAGLRPARLRRAVVEGRGQLPPPAIGRRGCCCRRSGPTPRVAADHAERPPGAGLGHARRLRPARLPGHAHLAGAGRVAGRPAAATASRCTCCPDQPAGRLHSQLDFGARPSAARWPAGSRCDLAGRRRRPGIADGDVVRVFNDRGACLAGVLVDEDHGRRRSACPPAPGSTRSTPTTPRRWSCSATRTC